jgi:hypothetical protein
MKTKSNDGQFKAVIKLRPYAVYVDELYYLESCVAQRPNRLQVDLAGSGRMPSDTVLLMQSILRGRPQETQLVTNARSSVHGAAVLLWLLGDVRMIRQDARLFVASAGEFAERGAVWRPRDCFDDNPFEDDDYLEVLRVINEYLPVREWADQPIPVSALRELGLVDNEAMEKLLADASRPAEEPPAKPVPSPESNPTESSG